MENHKCNEVETGECICDFQSESPCKGAHGFTSQCHNKMMFAVPCV